jgi:hypothetical protein
MRYSILSRLSLSVATVLLPLPVLAVAAGGDLISIIDKAFLLFNSLVGLFILVALVSFFWGLIKYLWSMGPDDAHKGLQIMLWGMIAIFVMVSIWGLVRLLQGTLGLGDTKTAVIPGGIKPATNSQGSTGNPYQNPQ